jgi:NAD+ diphosphatase
MSGPPLSHPRVGELPLSRYEFDRDYLARARPSLFDELAADPTTRFLLLWHGKGLLASEDGTELALVRRDAVPPAELWLYLGRSVSDSAHEPAGTPVVAVVLEDDDAAASVTSNPGLWGNLRSVGSTLTDRDAGMLTEALALANWHTSHLFSPRTGQPLLPELGGWVRRSQDDETAIFPRTDPAIIVLITDTDDRILLGSNALWESNRYSLLAGFVEPGESLEAAVIREVFEESRIRVVNPVYVGSQPWPFPASLMVGFRALADPAGGWVSSPDGAEILDLRWFSRDELQDAVGDIILPGATSIARFMIEDWFGGPVAEV